MIVKSKLVILAGLLAMTFTSYASAQQAPGGGKDFDPVTRALSDKNPTIADPNQAGQPGAAPQITPEQQAELDRQKMMADIAAKREEAKKKAADAAAARKAKEQAAMDADKKRMDAIKAARAESLKEQKDRRIQLASLLKEQKDARKAYEDSKKSSTGNTSQIDDDYRKAEKDREEKIKELRHPKYKPFHAPGTDSSGKSPVGTTALPGTITSGSGPTVTQH